VLAACPPEKQQGNQKRKEHQDLMMAAVLILRAWADRFDIDYPAVGINGEGNLILDTNQLPNGFPAPGQGLTKGSL